MSQASSDFSDDPFAGEIVEAEFEDDGVEAQPQVPAAPEFRKQGFSIYTMMLILSFLFLTTAAIMFFINADKY